MMGLPGGERSLTISSAVLIQYTDVTDGRTDEQLDARRQQRPCLHIASRGKNETCQPMASTFLFYVFVLYSVYDFIINK